MRNKQEGFEKYLENCNAVINDASLTDEEVRNEFYSLKTNESLRYDDISSNAIKVNKSEYIASLGQWHNMALNNFFLHLLNHVLKILIEVFIVFINYITDFLIRTNFQE